MLEQIPAFLCYKYQSQKVSGLSFEPWAVDAYQNQLFIANDRHEIEIRNASSPEEILTKFPTVDRVARIQYCPKGKYICSLEQKFRNGKYINFIRAYTNWSITGENSTMRARIACKVSPSYQTDIDSLEMIEIPLGENPIAFSCCVLTGNILILFGKSATLYMQTFPTLDISKKTYMDFKELCNIDIHFAATKVNLFEDIIAFVSSCEIHIIRIVLSVNCKGKMSSSTESTDKKSNLLTVKNEIVKGKLNHVNSNNTAIRDNGVQIDWIHLLESPGNSVPSADVSIVSLPFEAIFPNIKQNNAETIEILGPRINTIEFNVVVQHSDHEEKKLNTRVLTVLYKQFGKEEGDRTDVIKSVLMMPKHLTKPKSDLIMLDSPLKALSTTSHYFDCLITLEKEGFIYTVDNGPTYLASHLFFTSPIRQICLDHDYLHAITDVGLETYLLFHDVQSYGISPPENKVWLASMIPFMNIEMGCLSQGALHLLSYSGLETADHDDQSWTLYTLALPHLSALSNDMMELTNTADTYEQSHNILSASVFLVTSKMNALTINSAVSNSSMQLSTLENNICEELVSLGKLRKDLLHQLVLASIKEEKEGKLVVLYLKESQLSLNEVIYLLDDKLSTTQSPYLVEVCKEYLDDTLKLPNNEVFEPNISSFVVEFWVKHYPHDLSNLIAKYYHKLTCPDLVIPKADTVLETLKSRLKLNLATPLDSFVLLLLFCERNAFEQCGTIIKSLPSRSLVNLLTELSHLLFLPKKKEFLEFSKLAHMLKSHQLDCLIEVLASFSFWSVENFSNVLSIFVRETCDSSSTGHSTEMYVAFIRYLETFYHKLIFEHIGLLEKYTQGKEYLLRHYLSQLLKQQDTRTIEIKGMSGKSDVYGKRKIYLDHMEPFNCEKGICIQLKKDKSVKPCSCFHCNYDLLKLQSFMCSPLCGEKEKCVVDEFLSLHPNVIGYLSLTTLCLPIERSLNLILHNCPKAFLLMTKEYLKNLDQWVKVIADIKSKLNTIASSSKYYCDYSNLEEETLRHISQLCGTDQFLEILTSIGLGDKYNHLLKEAIEMEASKKLRQRIMKDHQGVNFVTLYS